jgi:hypothetical protein
MLGMVASATRRDGPARLLKVLIDLCSVSCSFEVRLFCTAVNMTFENDSTIMTTP